LEACAECLQWPLWTMTMDHIKRGPRGVHYNNRTPIYVEDYICLTALGPISWNLCARSAQHHKRSSDQNTHQPISICSFLATTRHGTLTRSLSAACMSRRLVCCLAPLHSPSSRTPHTAHCSECRPASRPTDKVPAPSAGPGGPSQGPAQHQPPQAAFPAASAVRKSGSRGAASAEAVASRL